MTFDKTLLDILNILSDEINQLYGYVVKKAQHIGWGYYDSISDMLNEAYPFNTPLKA